MRFCVKTGLFLLLPIFSFAQKGITFKLYQNSDFFTVDYQSFNSSTFVTTYWKDNRQDFTRLSLAIAWQGSKKLTHEVEILIPEISKSIEDVQFPSSYAFSVGGNAKRSISTYSIRYDVSKQLWQSKKWTFSLGAGLNPFFINQENTPLDGNSFYTQTKVTGVSVNVVPRLQYQITSRFGLDLNIPFKLYDFSYSSQYIANPTIPLAQQRSDGTTSTFLKDVYTIRFGVSYKL